MASLAASFEATRQARLPANAQIKNSARDWLLIDWIVTLTPTLLQRMAVIYDRDADQRILDVLTALNYTYPKYRANIVGVTESNGEVTCWYGDASTIEFARRALMEAAKSATWPGDRWTCRHVHLVPMTNGQLDLNNLAADHLLRIIPECFQLGLVRP